MWGKNKPLLQTFGIKSYVITLNKRKKLLSKKYAQAKVGLRVIDIKKNGGVFVSGSARKPPFSRSLSQSSNSKKSDDALTAQARARIVI